jgi:hypothetical protein
MNSKYYILGAFAIAIIGIAAFLLFRGSDSNMGKFASDKLKDAVEITDPDGSATKH